MDSLLFFTAWSFFLVGMDILHATGMSVVIAYADEIDSARSLTIVAATFSYLGIPANCYFAWRVYRDGAATAWRFAAGSCIVSAALAIAFCVKQSGPTETVAQVAMLFTTVLYIVKSSVFLVVVWVLYRFRQFDIVTRVPVGLA